MLLFSPGNGTNGSFYTALVEELASHGYVVAVIEHPYDVSAVLLSDGQTAHFAWEKWPSNDPGAAGGDRAVEEMIRERVAVRAADASFVLERLENLNANKTGQFSGRLDLARVGILGHSLGGMTAAQACQNDPRFQACLNLDGLVAGLPFFSGAQGEGLQQPFMFLTKTLPAPSEETLARLKVSCAEFQRRAQEAQVHLASAMASVSSGSYQVVIEGATHESFGDGPLLLPAPLNSGADKSLRITQIVRAYKLAFFENVLQDRPSALLEGGVQVFPEAILTRYPTK